jgi:hypothetical protein
LELQLKFLFLIGPTFTFKSQRVNNNSDEDYDAWSDVDAESDVDAGSNMVNDSDLKEEACVVCQKQRCHLCTCYFYFNIKLFCVQCKHAFLTTCG